MFDDRVIASGAFVTRGSGYRHAERNWQVTGPAREVLGHVVRDEDQRVEATESSPLGPARHQSEHPIVNVENEARLGKGASEERSIPRAIVKEYDVWRLGRWMDLISEHTGLSGDRAARLFK
jgi:hypothetical protein